MASSEFIDLRSNDVILKAAEYLRMLPDWKRSPGKLRTGYVEFGEILSRALVSLYCRLEGKVDSEKFDIHEACLANDDDEGGGSSVAREFPAMVADKHFEALNLWHLELAIVQDAFERVTVSVEDTDMGAIAHVLSSRFHDLVESCPFPESPAHEA